MNKTFSYVLVILITALIVGGGVYYWQNNSTEPITDTTNEIATKKEKVVSVADCSHLDSSWSQFSDDGTSLSFCFKKGWGETSHKETSISSEVKVGTAYHISFSKSIGNFPSISYSTLDYARLGDSDIPPLIDWSSLDFDKSNDELVKLFSGENATVEKMIINEKNVLKVHKNFVDPLSREEITEVDYFMPNIKIADTKYNLYVLGSPEIESDLDELLETLNF